MASLRLMVAVVGGAFVFAATAAPPVEATPSRSIATPAFQASHFHNCPCWEEDNSTSQQQLCDCQWASHTAGVYGFQCSAGIGGDVSRGGDGGNPVGHDGGFVPLPVRPFPQVTVAKPDRTRALCAAMAADGKITRGEAKAWRQMNCARLNR